jgi:hypothetical protein
MTLPGKAEIAAACRGLGLLLRGDARALQFYDLSEDGFWRSFRWPLIVGVVYAALLRPSVVAGADTVDPYGFMLVQALQILASWGIYLGLIAGLSRMFGLSSRYGIFVILYNWAQAIVTAASIPVVAGERFDLLPASVLLGWSAALLLAWFFIVSQVARIGLQGGLPVALAAAIFDLSISLAVYRLGMLLL